MQHQRVTGKVNRDGCSRLQRIATQAGGNLWLLPAATEDGSLVTASSLHQYLNEMRREFDYSIVVGRSAAESDEAIAMAQFADGIILVLSARHTRRATARWIKEGLEGTRARMIGTVLSDRAFPMPDAIYRRL
jgi:Mrp family chromosome partitioning ATPase